MAKSKKTNDPVLVKKLTMETLFGVKPKDHFLETRDEFFVGRIAGRITGARAGETTYGTYVRFTGQFRGISGRDGRITRAPVCLLPGFIEDELDAGFTATGEPIEFAYDIYTKVKEDASLGFEYVAEPLMEPASTVDSLMDQLPPLNEPLLIES